MPYMKQNKKHKQTLECAQYGLEISLNANDLSNGSMIIQTLFLILQG